MNPSNKQRVIGAVVLVALGLIIIPAVLDFSRDERSVDMKGVEIPAGPDALQMEVLPLEEWSQKVEPSVEVQGQSAAAEAAKSTEPPETISDRIEMTAPVAQQNEPTSIPAPIPAPLAQQPAATVKPVPAPKTATVAAGEGWMVQVASLTVEAKANELRDQLRKVGHPAFVERAKSGGSSLYRVKVGPVLERAAADDLKKQIKQATNLNGLVMQN